MPINPEIALGVKQFELPDPLAAYAKIATIKDAQNRNALSQLEFAKAKREETTTNALNDAYRAAYNPETGEVDYNALSNYAVSSGNGSLISGIEKTRREAEQSRLTGQKLNTEVISGKLGLLRETLGRVDQNSPDAPQQMMSVFSSAFKDPVLGGYFTSYGGSPEKTASQIANAVNSGKFSDLYSQSVLGIEKHLQNVTEQNKPQTELGKLIDARNRLSPGDPNRATYDAAITKATTHAPTGQMTPYQAANLEIARDKEARIAAEAKTKEEAAARAIESTAAGAEESARIVTGAIAKAKKLVSPTSTGFGSMLSGIPTTDARALEGQLNVVKANLGFDRLRQMREESKTGGALGSIAVKELERLEAAVATLDTGLEGQQLIDALDAVSTHYNKWLTERQKLTKKTGGAPAGGQNAPAPAKNFTYVPGKGLVPQ